MKPQRWVLSCVVTIVLVLGPAASGGALGPPGGSVGAAISVQERHTPRLLSIPGVVGTGVGLNDQGRPTIVVLTKTAAVRLPTSLDGVPVAPKVSGAISALHHREGHGDGGGNGGGGNGRGGNGGGGGGGVDPTQRFPRPIPIGVSTGNAQSTVGDPNVAAVCYTGTYGARVVRGATVYALSNNHVYANENLATIGSPITQPGPADNDCQAPVSDRVATLSQFVPLQPAGNTVDAAIAVSDTATIGNSTPTGGYGTPKSAPVAAALGMSVQKYGRTTGLTKGVVSVINLSTVVTYNTGPKVFDRQIGIDAAPRSTIMEGGDSGSLFVTDTLNPTGLGFAGNDAGDFGVANPIDLVLDAFDVAIDGTA